MEKAKKKKLYSFCYYWFIVLLFACIIFYSSTTTLKMRYYYRHQDKTLHFLAYASLGFVMVRAFYHTFFSKKSAWISIFVSIFLASLFGALIEVCQIYCNRFFEVADIIANTSGAIAGTLFYIAGYKKIYPLLRNKMPILLQIEEQFDANYEEASVSKRVL